MQARFPVSVPLDVARTLTSLEMWGGCTWMKVDETGAWYAQRERSGPATVHMVRDAEGVVATAYGPGGETLLARVPGLLGLDAIGVEEVVAHHDVVTDVKRRLAGLRMARSGVVYPQLVSVALAQKVTGKNSKAALRAIAWRWGEPAPGPRDDLMLLPEPKQLASTPYYAFHPLNIEQHRAELVRRIASRASALERAAGMSADDAMAHLQKLRGIGPWTAGVVCGGALGDPDAVPVGDAKLPGVVGYALAGERDADDARMLELLAPYAGHRGLVARMAKLGGPSRPRRGPKWEARDIRGA